MCISDWSSDVCSSDLMDILAVTRVEFVEDRDQPPGFDIGADMEDCETGYPSPAERKEARRVAVTGAHDRGRRHLDQTLPPAGRPYAAQRNGCVWRKSVPVRGEVGVRRNMKKKK